jgi:hypothetical protein
MAHNSGNTEIKKKRRQGVEIEIPFMFLSWLLRHQLQMMFCHKWCDDSDSKCVTAIKNNNNRVFYLVSKDQPFIAPVLECQGERGYISVTLIPETGYVSVTLMPETGYVSVTLIPETGYVSVTLMPETGYVSVTLMSETGYVSVTLMPQTGYVSVTLMPETGYVSVTLMPQTGYV